MSEEQNKPESYIQIVFAEVFSTQFSVNMGAVSPFQMIAVGEYLSMIGKNRLLEAEREEMERREQNRIQVPKPEIITSAK